MENQDALKKICVLYVEDDALLRTVIGRFLKRRCKEVYEAENGKSGMELYLSHEIHVVITDLEMPVMNGFEMVRKILEIRETQPIIITTGYSDDEHKIEESCRNLIKPIDEEELLDSILYCMNEKGCKY